MTNEGETCIYPDIHSSQMPNIPWRKEHDDQTDWYSNLRGGFRVNIFTRIDFKIFPNLNVISFR